MKPIATSLWQVFFAIHCSYTFWQPSMEKSGVCNFYGIHFSRGFPTHVMVPSPGSDPYRPKARGTPCFLVAISDSTNIQCGGVVQQSSLGSGWWFGMSGALSWGGRCTLQEAAPRCPDHQPKWPGNHWFDFVIPESALPVKTRSRRSLLFLLLGFISLKLWSIIQFLFAFIGYPVRFRPIQPKPGFEPKTHIWDFRPPCPSKNCGFRSRWPLNLRIWLLLGPAHWPPTWAPWHGMMAADDTENWRHRTKLTNKYTHKII